MHVSLLTQTDQPTLIECIRFRGKGRRINIPQEIGVQYHQFGIFLLEDNTMAKVNSITHKHKNDVEQINSEIIQQWIAGRGKLPVNWKTLTGVLHDSELHTLAEEIEAVKCEHSSEQRVTRVLPDGDFEPNNLSVATGNIETFKQRDSDILATNIIVGEDSKLVSIGNVPARPHGIVTLERRFTEDVIATGGETVRENLPELCRESAKVNVTGELLTKGEGVLKCEHSERKIGKDELSSTFPEVGGALSANVSTS